MLQGQFFSFSFVLNILKKEQKFSPQISNKKRRKEKRKKKLKKAGK
jgi:hypothetical protein